MLVVGFIEISSIQIWVLFHFSMYKVWVYNKRKGIPTSTDLYCFSSQNASLQ